MGISGDSPEVSEVQQPEGVVFCCEHAAAYTAACTSRQCQVNRCRAATAVARRTPVRGMITLRADSSQNQRVGYS